MLLFCAISTSAQTFTAATVRVGGDTSPTLNHMVGGPGSSDPTHFAFDSVPLVSLMMRAWHVDADQIKGPEWVKNFSDPRTLYTVRALVPADTTADQFDVMLRNLLTERFHLTFHRETKEFPGYELRVADGGLKIQPCVPEEEAGSPGTEGRKRCVKLPPGGIMTTSLSSGIGTWGAIRQRHMTSMADFADRLGAAINESSGLPEGLAAPRVTDKTGLNGNYDFSLEFAGVVLLAGTPPPASIGDPEAGTTVFVALERQLGLKLVKTKNVTVDLLVIDYANKVPAEN